MKLKRLACEISRVKNLLSRYTQNRDQIKYAEKLTIDPYEIERYAKAFYEYGLKTEKLIKEKKTKQSLLSIICLVLAWGVEIIILIPRADLYMNINMIHTLKDAALAIVSVIFSGITWYEQLYIGTGIILFVILALMLIKLKRL